MDFMDLYFSLACVLCGSPAKVLATEWKPQDGIPLCNKCKRKHQNGTIQDLNTLIETQKKGQ